MSKVDELLKALDRHERASDVDECEWYARDFVHDHGALIRAMAMVCKDHNPILKIGGGWTCIHCYDVLVTRDGPEAVDHAPDCAWLAFQKENQ